MNAEILSRPLVIGTLHSAPCLAQLAKNNSPELLKCDFLEVRLDALRDAELPAHWPCPMIATARHPAEGGLTRIFHTDLLRKPENLMNTALDSDFDLDSMYPYSPASKSLPALSHQALRLPRHDQYEISGLGDLIIEERRDLLEKAISWASAIDVELRSFAELAATIAHARAKGCALIASFHDFEGVPSTEVLEKMAHQAEAEGADFLKIAVTPRNEEELESLVHFQKNFFSEHLRLAAMGMGPLGRLSRQRLAKEGAALVYGWLYHPQMTGQPSVGELLKNRVVDF